MDRTTRLEKQFDAIIKGKQPLTTSNYTNFIDSIVAQTHAPTCASRIMSSKSGLSSLQSAMRFDLSPHFFNDRVASLLKYLQHPDLSTINGGTYLHQLLQHILEPPIFWLSFCQAFRDGKLNHAGQLGFAWLVFQRASISVLETAKLSCSVVEDVILELMKKSPHLEVRDFAGRIGTIILPGASGKAVFSAGGRHDNDFADYTKVEILPTASEIRCPDRAFFLPKTCIEDPSTEDRRLEIYLDNEFRLLREDMLCEMKEELAIATGQKKGKRRTLVIDGLQFHGVNFGSDVRRERWALELQCEGDILHQVKGKSVAAREKFLRQNRLRPFRHQAWSCLMIDDEITAFPTLNRTEELLAKDPPVIVLFIDDRSTERTLSKLKNAQRIRLIILETAVFSFEPILKALQGTLELSLHQELLHWKDGDTLRSPPDIPTGIVDSIRRDPCRDLRKLLNTPKSIRLDSSQHASLLAALTQRVSLIQGPPGTGKSFIGALLAKILHDHTDQKVLVVCYTNHALDQFLEDLLDIGIPSDKIVRLGGKSTPRTSCLALKEYSQKSSYRLNRDDWEVIDALKFGAEKDAGTLTTKLEKYAKHTVRSQELLEYLQLEEPEIYFYFCVPRDQDGMTAVGSNGRPIKETYLIKRWKRGGNPGDYRHLAQTSIWSKSLPERQQLLEQWISAMDTKILTEVTSLASKYNNSLKQLEYIFSKRKNSVIAGKPIIGCTTTAAAMYHDQLREARPEVLLVEEAGEILESHIITAMNLWTDQLILIGDHKQLRPKVNNYNLTVEKGEGYDLNMSLFERLVLRGYPHQTLTQQHRMRPEISSLVRQLTYPDLVDAPQTLKRPFIRGLQDSVIFINHTHPEDELEQVAERRDMNSTASKQNIFEVDMVLKMLKYLAQQGYRTDTVTILTPYLAQLHKLRKALMEGRQTDPVLNDLDSHDLVQAGLISPADARADKKSVRLATIDNYQGEESDIIIVSLTRSNAEHNIGFMFCPERLNVLLSRARNGLIMIGNSNTFTKSRKGGDLWTRLLDMLRAQGHIYEGFPVKCERHPDQKAILRAPIDFEREAPEGGCKESCGTRLNCGLHDCPSRCHKLVDHSKMECRFVVKLTCPQDHSLSYWCYQGPPASCRKCDSEAKAAQKKREAALAEQQKRAAEQLEHAKEMAKVEAQIAEEQRAQDERDRQERKALSEQKKRDLENMRGRHDRITEEVSSTQKVPQPSLAPSHSPLPPVVNVVNAQQTTTQPAPSALPRHLYVPAITPSPSKAPQSSSESAENWRRQKRVEYACITQKVGSSMKLAPPETTKTPLLQPKLKPVQTSEEDEDEGREEGVSDRIWRQLKLDQAAQVAKQRKAEQVTLQLEKMRKQEEEARLGVVERQRTQDEREKTLLRALRRAQVERARLREKEERERLEQQEEEQRKEAEVQQRLRDSGVCVAGHGWIKQFGGYRCAGGAHFVSNGRLGL